MNCGTFTLLKTGKILSYPFVTILLLWSMCISSCNRNNDDDELVEVKPTLELVASDFASPVALVEPPDQSGRLFVVDQPGKIWILMPDGRKLSEPFLDLSASMIALSGNYDERGLLGLAFHPQYQSNGRFYVFYTVPSNGGGPAVGIDWNHVNRVSEFRVSGNKNIADPASERVILEENHPAMNHNGGTIAFGPDGYLYISIGDGGHSNDVGPGHFADWYTANAGGNAQNLRANLLGKMLRIDVNNGSTYSIPADNPFINVSGARQEIYAYGFRNPYRFSFDMGGSRKLYVGDAGQVLYEEINDVSKGGNYGWNVKEGTICFNTDNNKVPRGTCPSSDTFGMPLIDPVIQLKNAANPAGGEATVIVGGYVYRGTAFPQLQGAYIFGSFSQKSMTPDGKLYFSHPSSSAGLRSYAEVQPRNYETTVGQYIKGLGQDLNGEIYILTTGVAGPSGNTGRVYKMVAVPQ